MQSCFWRCAGPFPWLYPHHFYLAGWQLEKFCGMVQGSESSRGIGVRHCLEAVLSAMLLQCPMVRHTSRIASSDLCHRQLHS